MIHDSKIVIRAAGVNQAGTGPFSDTTSILTEEESSYLIIVFMALTVVMILIFVRSSWSHV